MLRLRGRLARLVFAVLIVLGLAVDASAQPRPAQPVLRRAESDDVTVLAPPPVPPPPPVAAAVELPPDLSSFLGQTLASVDVVLDDARWSDEKAPMVSVMRPGDALTTALVRRAQEEALASGHFASARTTLDSGAGGVRAVIHLMPRKVIDALRVDAHGAPIDADALLRDADLVTDGELVAGQVHAHADRIEAQLMRRGFSAPQVKISTRPTDDPLRVVVDVDIQVGAPRKIERRVVYPIGAGRPEASFVERAYTAKAGDRADEPALDTADLDLQTRVRARGFLKAEVSHDVVMHRGFVVLRVRVDFGTHYETRYDGNDHYDKSTLDEELDIEGETDRTPSHLLQKIHDFYVKHGFLDVEVKLEDRGGPGDKVHFLVFHVIEHERVHVMRREYPCLREGDVQSLVEGGPTSAKAIGTEIDSYLEEELPGNELLVPPRVSGVDRTIGRSVGADGAHPTPVELDPDTAYVPETYERAVAHVQELYRSEGFLSAQVGPVQVLRRKCDPRSPPGECRTMKIPTPPDVCTYDANGMPMPVPPLEAGSSCEPDPVHGVRCAPRVQLRIPVKLGPRTQLWDIAFSGTTAIAPSKLVSIAAVGLGSWVSAVKLDEARRRVSDAYKEEGYAFVDVKYAIELSPDRTRARVRFTVTEGEQVIVRAIVIKGNVNTHTHIIQKRIALEVGQPYRASLVRKTQERVATLGPFASVDVALDDPYVPQRNKVVVVSVVEKTTQYVEPRVGFSTGEGFRLAAEYGHINLWGNAVALTTRSSSRICSAISACASSPRSRTSTGTPSARSRPRSSRASSSTTATSSVTARTSST
jgi:outer membrane protein insertion porin family